MTDAPVVDCESSWAHVGDRNVFLRCKVKARPKVTALFWILDANGTTVTEGQVVDEHWTLVTVGHVIALADVKPLLFDNRRQFEIVTCEVGYPLKPQCKTSLL